METSNNSIWMIPTVFFTLAAGFLIGYLLEELSFPYLAIIIRDITAMIMELIGFNVEKTRSFNFEWIGLSLPEYHMIESGESIELHGFLTPHCVLIWLFLTMTGYYLAWELKPVIERRETLSSTVNKEIIVKAVLLFVCFIPYTVIRYIIIVLVFVCLWNTSLWSCHNFIGHDIVGSIVILIPACLLLYRLHSAWLFSKLQNL